MVDLHIHSNYSDGNKHPKEIIEICKNNGINTISFADHNTIKEYDDKSVINSGIEIIKGAEFYPDMDNVKMFHLLAYDFNLNQEILALFQELDNNRLISMQEKLEFIEKKYGINVDINNLSKIWLSNYTLRNYLLKSYNEKYVDTIINSINEAGFKINRKVDYIKLLHIIRNANGIPVLAHPKSVICEDFNVFIKELIANGLMGIEVYHSSHNQNDVNKYMKIANEHNLLISGGSDFHGYGKFDYNGNDVHLGTYYCDDYSKINVLKFIRERHHV